MSHHPYFGIKESLSLAIAQKTEKRVRQIINKPSEKFFYNNLNHFDYIEEMAHFYIIYLMDLINENVFGPEKMFWSLCDNVLEETNGYEMHVNTLSIDILANAMRAYGEENFRDLLDEADKVIGILEFVFVDRVDYYVKTNKDQIKESTYSLLTKSYKPELETTYFFYWDYSYSNDMFELFENMELFAAEYVELVRKILNRINCLKGGELYDRFLKN